MKNGEQKEGLNRRRFLAGATVAGLAHVPLSKTSRVEAQETRGPMGALPNSLDAAMEHDTPEGYTEGQAANYFVDHPGSDFMVDVLKTLEFDYLALNPGSAFRGLHESLLNTGGNTRPEILTCVHEEHAAAIAHGYAKVAKRPMAIACHGTVGIVMDTHLQEADIHEHGRLPICITGDGDTMYVPGVNWTAAHHRIPLLTVVHNNRAYHQEVMHVQKTAAWRQRGVDKGVEPGNIIDDPAIDFAASSMWASAAITVTATRDRAVRPHHPIRASHRRRILSKRSRFLFGRRPGSCRVLAECHERRTAPLDLRLRARDPRAASRRRHSRAPRPVTARTGSVCQLGSSSTT